MPNPVTPSRVAALINSLLGVMCERMAKVFQFTNLLDEEVRYYVNEAGLPSDEFKADLCEALADCVGTGNGSEEPVNPNMPAPQNLIASDDSFSDKIQVSWDPVDPPTGIDDVTEYRVYRGTTSSFGSATLVATVTAPTVVVDDPVDGDLVAGTTYHYWVRATNGVDTSAPSNRDTGRAASEGEIGELDAVEDLIASVGFGNSFISLAWTPPTGATHYDIWRGTTAVFADATKIYSDISPAATTLLSHPTDNPTFWNNVETLLLYDTPPSATTDYYYFVVAKKNSPPAESEESNSALGRVKAPAIYNGTENTLLFSAPSIATPPATTRAWVVVFPGGAGGAGGNDVYGGGGGGGGQIVREVFTGLSEGDVLELVFDPNDQFTTNAPSETNGEPGTTVEFQIETVSKITAEAGQGGEFDAAGGGAGGAAGTGSVGTTSPTIYNGYPGMPGSGSSGGRSGYAFSQRRLPQGDALGPFNGDGSTAHAGSGAKAIAVNALLAVGGKGYSGKAFVVFGA